MGLSKISNVANVVHPRATDDRGQRRLRRCVRANRRATVEQLTAQMNQGATNCVSETTVQRTLLSLGLRIRRLWQQVAFSDESRFMLHRTDGRWRIRRETSESKHPATIAGSVQARALERNVAQLAKALESAWLDIPVNTFRNLELLTLAPAVENVP
ncbi:hypothetical protein HPB52_024453 [Rhipicephalus sanguineus]|uniref:Transposase Tc1-like domain-containing protein n=1 Tax=Rhipicephalus sanguineus TaxID=34632 RepID=A0A9D4TCE9_RHISA|nr:hypothetical protein HPB52_024453 [Rhipicephalus sanguineus]